jgi:uncharacterized protein YukE
MNAAKTDALELPAFKSVFIGVYRRFTPDFPLEAHTALCYLSARQDQTRGTNMPSAIMDPGEVRRFAEELKRFNTETQNRMSLLQARFAALGDTWQDQEHAKFSEEFRDTMKVLKKFIESSNQHTPFLLRKAQRIEEYLNQH